MYKKIPGYSKYEISARGEIISSFKKGLAIKPFKRGNYLAVSLVNDKGIRKKENVHKLVILAFIGDPG